MATAWIERPEAESTPSRTRRARRFWRAFARHGYGPVGLALLALVAGAAALAEVIAPFPPQQLNPDLLHPPGGPYLLGTDHLGRDVFSGVIHGTRVSLLVAVSAAAISGLVGTVVGAVSGYFGGWLDEVVSRLIDIFLMVPAFFLILIVVVVYGSSLYYVMAVIGLTIWPANARLMRAQALSLRERTFVVAKRALGEGHLRILLQHIVPNGIHPVLANTTLQMASAILTEAALSFIGLGDPNRVSWGRMIYEGRSYLTTGWWVATFPGLAIVLTVMGFYLVGDALQYALNPQLQEGDRR